MPTIPQEQLEAYLLDSLRLSIVEWRDDGANDGGDVAAVRRAIDWMLALGDAGVYHLPFYLVLDLGTLLCEGYETAFSRRVWPRHRDQQLHYERRLLNQLLQTPVVTRAIDIAAFGPTHEQRQARLLVLLCRTLARHYPDTRHVNPSYLRNLEISSSFVEQLALSNDEHDEQHAEWWEDETELFDALRAFLSDVEASVRWSELLEEEDLFELEHFEALHNEQLRAGCRQIIEVERRLGELDVRRFNIEQEDAEAHTLIEDQTHYPAGGLAELTNRGAFENLVLSELVYTEEGNEIDLFDVRYAEGELLFFQRDAGQLLRRRRSVHIVFDLGDVFAAKSLGYDYRFSTLVQGLGLRLIRDLMRLFEHDSVHAHLHYIHGDRDRATVEGEARLMRELLADEVRHGRASVNVAAALEAASLLDPKRKSYAVLFTDDAARAPDVDASVATLSLEVGRDVPTTAADISADSPFAAEPNAALALPLRGLPFDAIRTLRERALAALVGEKHR